MDSYLSGRDRSTGPKKSNSQAELAESSPLGDLVLPASAEAELGETCGEGGSRVAYVNEGGKVTKIVVTCACGQITEIDCRYDD